MAVNRGLYGVFASTLVAAVMPGTRTLAAGAVRDLDGAGEPVHAAPADPAIAQALQQISARHIRHTIETLVGFGTRNTLSSTLVDLPGRQGVRAAADWIEAEFNRYSAQCGGCLEVKRDTFTEAVQERIPRPTTITNIYAILHGSDPAQTKRIYLVTGHYDSRNSDVLDARGAAPGANDDASGVAVSLECALVLSRLKLPATIIFAAVAGEEQGLNGSRHLAKLAKSEGWQLEGVLNNDIVGGNLTPGDRWQDNGTVRVFSEGIPAAALSGAAVASATSPGPTSPGSTSPGAASPEAASAPVIRQIQTLGYESDSPSREVARAVLEISDTYFGSTGGAGPGARSGSSGPGNSFHPTLEFRRDRFLRGGDHTSFNQEGFAAVRFTEWREDFNHQHQNVRTENGVEYGDLPQFVDYDYVARVAALNAAALATFASAPAAPVNVRILTKALDNDTTLQWSPGAGASSGTRYEVVWRELAAARWQRALESGAPAARGSSKPDALSNVQGVPAEGLPQTATPPNTQGLSQTLPVSKDNVIFGVRAVDAQGHRGPAVVPWPER